MLWRNRTGLDSGHGKQGVGASGGGGGGSLQVFRGKVGGGGGVGWGGFTGWLGFKRRTGKSQGEDARQERLAVRVAGSTDRVVMVGGAQGPSRSRKLCSAMPRLSRGGAGRRRLHSPDVSQLVFSFFFFSLPPAFLK